MKAWMLLFFAAFSGSVFSQSHLIVFKVEDKSIPCRIELKSDVQISEQNIESLQAKYLKEITELKNLIGNKSSIPKD